VSGRLTADLAAFFAECVYPAEAEFAADGGTGSIASPVLTRVRDEARRRGLWNLFSSLHPARLAVGDPETADLAEIVGRSPVIGQVALHSLNPDATVLELLAALGSAEQASAWLDALADGTISSAYCMTEPGVASSDPRSLRTRGERAADGTVRVTGVKSWCTGADAANCEILVVLALTEPDAGPAGRYSLVLVRRDSPGVAVANRHDVLGYSDAYRGGHPDIVFTDAPGELLGEAGGGLAAAQRVLGPARMLHSMRLVGTAERALELMTGRLRSREVRGRPLAGNDLWIDRVRRADRRRIDAGAGPGDGQPAGPRDGGIDRQGGGARPGGGDPRPGDAGARRRRPFRPRHPRRPLRPRPVAAHLRRPRRSAPAGGGTA